MPATGRPWAVAGAQAPAPAPGLSKGHKSPQPMLTEHTGGTLVQVNLGCPILQTINREPDPWAWVERGLFPEPVPRGTVKSFSRKSRQRLRMSLARVDQTRCARPIFATLTYPKEFPWASKIFKGHLDAFGKRFSRSFPMCGFHWKLEFQERGAPHFHPIFWNLPTNNDSVRAFRQWLAEAWFAVVGSGDPAHLSAGTSADVVESQFGILRYVASYVSESDQSHPGETVGRYWGIVGRKNIPWAQVKTMELTVNEAHLVRRIARRYMQAMNRERRIRHLGKFLPNASEMMLSGKARQLRKEHPRLNAFEYRPKKLRLKNNGNVNLFCNASFWVSAIRRMLARNLDYATREEIRSDSIAACD